MLSTDQYELLDFGDGRKLERFGDRMLDRPSPTAEDAVPRSPELWPTAVARFERTQADRGQWTTAALLPETWMVSLGPSAGFECKLTEFGHVGLFPEQMENWGWIRRTAASVPHDAGAATVLNLFAYTGASTLAAALAGAQVAHVDAAQNTVNWARRNAQRSGLAQVPIRWIAEDALKFVRRELKRGNAYDAVILDPPSYGHGPKGEPWKLAEHLPELLSLCAQLTAGRRRFMLLTCHSPGYGPKELRELLLAAVRETPAQLECGNMTVATRDRRRLHCGSFARLQ